MRAEVAAALETNRGPRVFGYGEKAVERGRDVRRAVRAAILDSDIARHAPRPDSSGWAVCAGCRQSCTGGYAGKAGCHRCGIVGAR